MTEHPEARGVIWLRNLAQGDAPVAGAKAANLGELMRAGLPVPDGFAVTPGADREAVLSAAAALGDPVAVRSSATAEDLPGASFAGQYETILGVRGPEGLLDAIRRCRASGQTAQVEHYRAARTGAVESRMAVLVQRMLSPEAAGVAFTANPVTGARAEVVITAGRGLGERVVSGEAVGDEWVVTRGRAVQRRSVERAIDAAQAQAIAGLARRVEERFGRPQDIEWAIEDARLYLLQARPMTALPDPVDWAPPTPGYWMRNFRLGEWLSEPMTPLFQDWLLERIEEGYLVGMRRTTGAAVPFRHAAINGWYYTATPRYPPLAFLPAAIRSRGRTLWALWYALVRVGSRPDVADRRVLRREMEAWRTELLPRYQFVVARAETGVESATLSQLADVVDEVGRVAGEYLWSLAVVGGSAWKMEACLGRFLRRHLAGVLDGGVLVLLRGLPGADPEVPAHAVQTVDWCRPTAGELGWNTDQHWMADRTERMVAERVAAEAACRQALWGQPDLLARFDILLDVAQRYTAVREEQARQLTLGWPLLRTCVLRMGTALRVRRLIEDEDDVFFLTRDELERDDPLQATVQQRREEWEGRRRMVAPLTIGKPARLLENILARAVDAVRTPGAVLDGAVVGEPASPGRATGRVRVVSGPEDFDRFRHGEVLVARATAPAWTALFGRAVAVVTDGGTLAAHASVVAREYGIPAVVGTGDATSRLHDGQVVTVDGGAGVVELAGAPAPGGERNA
jgi:rifampicin phosphotransferase